MIAASSSASARRCAFVIFRSPGPILESVAVGLRRRGVVTEFLKRPLMEPRAAFDLIVLRDRTRDVLRWAKFQQSRNSLVLPEPHKVEVIKDRWTCRGFMVSAGATFPESMVGTASQLATSGVERLLPVVIKRRTLHGKQLRPINTKSELSREIASHAADEELVAERYILGTHYTAAFVGEQEFVFERPAFALTTLSAKRLPAPPQGVIDTVKQYRSATGFAFGKIDVVVTRSGKVLLLDCGVSPDLWLVSEADEVLTKYFVSQLGARMN
jgi:hypothetical protein